MCNSLWSICLLAVVSAMILFQFGCLADNPYETNYTALDSALASHFVKGEPGTIKISPVITEDGIISALEEGYIPIGVTATYTGRHCPWVCALQKAEEVGADLVLIDEVHKGTGSRTSVVFLPTFQYTATTGSVSGNLYGSAGTSAYVSGTYNGAMTSTALTAAPVQVPVEIYEQTAMFLRKGTFENFYGAFLYIPPLLPDESDDSVVPVTVLAVLRGSEASRDGLKKGQRVLSINGTRIRTRRDVAPFESNPKLIKSIVVAK